MVHVWMFSSFLMCSIVIQSGQTFAGFVNVAKYKTTSMSGGDGAAREEKGVDGNNDGSLWSQCILTGSGQPYTWWEVDLGNTYYILHVKIYFRTDFKKRRNGIHVYASTTAKQNNTGHLCGAVTGKPDGSDIDDVTTINCNADVRYITIYQATDNGAGNSMDFCEIQVSTCDQHTYGSNCNTRCDGRNCLDAQAQCPAQTGSCGGRCEAEWTGGDCTQEKTGCNTGTYGTGCPLSCDDRHCSGSQSCDELIGRCVHGCKPGWQGTDCTQECSAGHYGPGCTQLCSSRQCSGSQSCDKEDGSCLDGCLPGWTGNDCTREVE